MSESRRRLYDTSADGGKSACDQIRAQYPARTLKSETHPLTAWRQRRRRRSDFTTFKPDTIVTRLLNDFSLVCSKMLRYHICVWNFSNLNYTRYLMITTLDIPNLNECLSVMRFRDETEDLLRTLRARILHNCKLWYCQSEYEWTEKRICVWGWVKNDWRRVRTRWNLRTNKKLTQHDFQSQVDRGTPAEFGRYAIGSAQGRVMSVVPPIVRDKYA